MNWTIPATRPSGQGQVTGMQVSGMETLVSVSAVPYSYVVARHAKIETRASSMWVRCESRRDVSVGEVREQTIRVCG